MNQAVTPVTMAAPEQGRCRRGSRRSRRAGASRRKAACDATPSTTATRIQMPTTRDGLPVSQPFCTASVSRSPLKLIDGRQQLPCAVVVGDEAVRADPGGDRAEQARFGRGDWAVCPVTPSPRLLAEPRNAVVLAELHQAPRRQIHHRRRDRPARRPVVHRAASPSPASARPAGPASGPSCRRRRSGRGRACTSGRRRTATRNSARMQRRRNPPAALMMRARFSSSACSGVAAASTSAEGDRERAVEVGGSVSSGFMSLSKTAWRSALVMNAALKPLPAYSETWPWIRLSCMSNRITRPSSKPLRPDAPLVHQRQRVGVGRVEAVALRLDLRVDRDLGAGPGLDGVDRLPRRGRSRPGEKMPA